MREVVDVRFEERQSFGVLFVIIMVAAVGGVVGAEVLAFGAGKPLNLLRDLAIAVPVFLLLMNPSRLTTRVTDDCVYVRLGVWVPFFVKRIPLASIRGCRSITYRPLLDAGGWGIRMGRFEGGRLWYYNARGDRGVLLELDGTRCVIGSQQPDDLVYAITTAVREREGRTL